MDKLQKVLKGLWRFKERFVLIVLLGVLCYKVYDLFVPKVPEAAPADQTGKADPPEPPPNNPPVDAPGQYAGLYRSNGFTYFSDAPTSGESGLTGKEAGIELVDLKEVRGKWRARLKTVTTKWYDEGEAFEEFKLESINPDDKTVVVYAERFAKTVTLRLP